MRSSFNKNHLRIARVRRAYNRWVADQSFEDYALRFTALSARQKNPLKVAFTALGSVSFMALEAIGGSLTLAFGFQNTVLAILLITAIIFCISIPLCFMAAKSGLDIDLLTRGTGFGYIGSTITSLLYASFTFIFFGIEAAILANTINAFLFIPLPIAYLLSAIVVIPLVARGITFISRFQISTQPIWFILNFLPLAVILISHPEWVKEWTHFTGNAPLSGKADIVAIGYAASIMFVLICQSAEQVDFLRFLPPRTTENYWKWWTALLMGGPGWILCDCFKLLAGSFLTSVIINRGFSLAMAIQPCWMYRFAYGTFASPALATGLTLGLITIAQIKINATNAYAGSLAWSNFFSRLTHSHPGRVFYVFFNIAIALLLMEAGLVDTIQTGIILYAVFAAAWIGAILGDIVLCKPMGFSPEVDFKRAVLPDLNLVGLGATALGCLLGILSLSSVLGSLSAAFAPFVALLVACFTAPILGYVTKGRSYIARNLPKNWQEGSLKKTCVICGHQFEVADMAPCPAYGGAICSLCCSLDSRCHDRCKPAVYHFAYQLLYPLRYFSAPIKRGILSPFGRFISIMLTVSCVLGGLAFYAGEKWHNAFIIVFLVASVVAWLIVLGQDGQRKANRETLYQTRLLMNEIRAHRRTDEALKQAREKAEAASLAKTRYISGISHEIRSPLNAIMGYTQILQQDGRVPEDRQQALHIMRESGEHVTAILSGLLDISRIEAGRIKIYRDKIELSSFLEAVVQMMRLQAQEKGLDFFYHHGDLPSLVHGDEYRLRQILINLLSNAIKYTKQGSVTFQVHWRSQIGEFLITDTGAGIRPEDKERIFEPFGRGSSATGIQGTGLGLTITKLLTEVLGGELTFKSEVGSGTEFRVRLMLSDIPQDSLPLPKRIPTNYQGERCRILVVDDNDAHRHIMREFLEPRGFIIEDVNSGEACLEKIKDWTPNLILLDLSMPGMDGQEVALRIRKSQFSAIPIIFLTGNLVESTDRHVPSLEGCPVIGKPVNLTTLINEIGQQLHLSWMFPKRQMAENLSDEKVEEKIASRSFSEEERAMLLGLLNRGDLKKLREALTTLQASIPALYDVTTSLIAMAASYQLEALRHALQKETE